MRYKGSSHTTLLIDSNLFLLKIVLKINYVDGFEMFSQT
jgi:hypothetical protein